MKTRPEEFMLKLADLMEEFEVAEIAEQEMDDYFRDFAVGISFFNYENIAKEGWRTFVFRQSIDADTLRKKVKELEPLLKTYKERLESMLAGGTNFLYVYNSHGESTEELSKMEQLGLIVKVHVEKGKHTRYEATRKGAQAIGFTKKQIERAGIE